MISESTVDIWYLMLENDPAVRTCHLQYLPAVEKGRCTSTQHFKVLCSCFLTLLILGPQ